MDKQITAVLIKEGKGEVVTFYDNLTEIYKLIGADMIEMPTRYIGHRPYYLIVDEEGLLRTPRKAISAICTDGNEMLLGNILVVPAYEDEKGNLVNCEIDDVAVIVNAITKGVLFYECQR